jgi:site-specific recombinase XerD
LAQYNEAGALLPSYGQETQLTNKSVYREKVQRLLRASVAPETRRAYSSRLKHFFSWCEDEGVPAFPASPEILAAYIAHLADLRASCSTVGQTMAAISAAHKAEGLLSPTDSLLIKKLIKGYRREHGTAPQRKDAATVDIIRALLAVTMRDNSTKAVRDAAIIALGFAGAFRRSELSALNMDDLKWTLRNDEEVLLVEVRRSKTDQEGQGMVKAIFPSKDENTSPTALLKRWLSMMDSTTDGPLFREVLKNGRVTDKRLNSQSIRLIVKQAAADTGLTLDLSAHSLRSGFVTTAIRQGKTERSIMNQTGHRSIQTLRDYFRREDAIEDNAARGLM